jgi:hypothetical protein
MKTNMTNETTKTYTITRNNEACGYQGETMTLKDAKIELARRLKNFRVNNPTGKFELMITAVTNEA